MNIQKNEAQDKIKKIEPAKYMIRVQMNIKIHTSIDY